MKVGSGSGEPATGPGRETRAAIRLTAIDLFQRKGFEVATLRELAAEVGIEAASLYNHFPSKQALLADILLSTMAELVAALEVIDEPEPIAHMGALVARYVGFHEHHLAAAAITETERRSLGPADLRALLELRERLSGIFEAAIRRGVGGGDFVVDDVSISNLCVLSICSRVATWYRPGGRLSLDDVAGRVVDVCLRALGVAR